MSVGAGVTVAVAVAVLVSVAVGVEVNKDKVEVGVSVGVSMVTVAGGLVFVGFRFGVVVGVEGKNTNVFVGLVVITSVWVAEETVVGAGEDVDVAPSVENGVRVMIDTPGVRKSTQPGGVRMDASTGSMSPPGLRVR